MRSVKCILTILLFISFAALYGQKETPPEGGTPKDLILPQPDAYSLDNGLNVTKVQFGGIPKVTIRLVIRVGNLNEQADEVWLSDLTADLLKEGTKKYSAEEIARKAASMGGELDINTGMDETDIDGDVLSEFAPDLIALISEVIQNPSFNDEAINRLKKDFIRRMSISKTRAQSVALEKFRNALYPDHPYGRIYPTEEMVNSYSNEKVNKFFNDNYGARRAHLYIVGIFDDDAVDEAVSQYFSGWKEGPDIYYNIPEPVTKREIILSDRPDATQSTIYLGLPVCDPSNRDYIPLSITNTLLGGYFSSRITANIREDKGYTYSPNSSISSRYHDAYYVQTADVSTDVTAEALKEIFYEIDRLRKEPPTEEELEGVQNYAAGIFVLRNGSKGSIINQLSYIDLHGLSDDYLSSYVKKVYEVTPQDVTDMANKYIRDEDMTIVIVGDEKKVKDKLSSFSQPKVKG